MRKIRIFLVLGILVALIPYLGFSYYWKDVLETIAGLVIACFGYMIYTESKTKEVKVFDNFLENKFEGDINNK